MKVTGAEIIIIAGTNVCRVCGCGRQQLSYTDLASLGPTADAIMLCYLSTSKGMITYTVFRGYYQIYSMLVESSLHTYLVSTYPGLLPPRPLFPTSASAIYCSSSATAGGITSMLSTL